MDGNPAAAKAPVYARKVISAKRLLRKRAREMDAMAKDDGKLDSLKSALEELHADITIHKDRGAKWREIAKILNEAGIEVAEKTVRVRWGENEKKRLEAERAKAERIAARLEAAKAKAAKAD